MLERLQEKASFLVLFAGRGIGSYSILSKFCRCWVHERCSRIGKLKEGTKFKCQTCASQQTGIAEDCPGIELNRHSLEIVERFSYLGDTIGARGNAVVSVITRIRSG